MGSIDWLHVIDSMKDGFYRLTETNKCTLRVWRAGSGGGSSAGKIFSYTDRAKVTRLLTTSSLSLLGGITGYALLSLEEQPCVFNIREP